VSIKRLLLGSVGLLLLQLSWITVIPAFGGIDEFDHVYRAASVARGEWAPPPTNATRGTGAWVHVPADLVTAARAQCEALPYTTSADCVGTRSGDTVRIATGAGRYHPLFYALIGWLALPFHGETALYAMRIATAILCSILFFLGLLSIRSWARGPWAYVGALAACTPVLIYSTSIASPNGFEMTAAFAFWSALIGLFSRAPSDSTRSTTALIATAVLSGSLLVTVRSLGPLWALLIVLTVMVAMPESVARLLGLFRNRRFLVGLAILFAAGLASVMWIEKMSALEVGADKFPDATFTDKLNETVGLVPLWLFQSIAAFPLRGHASVPIVYLAIFVVAGTIFGIACRYATRRERVTLALCIVLSTAVPFAITMQTLDDYAAAWQGRYGLPYSLGLLLLSGLALDRHARHPKATLVPVAAGLTALASVAAQAHVLGIEKVLSPTIKSGEAHVPPLALLIALGIVGAGLLWSPAFRAINSGPDAADKVSEVGQNPSDLALDH
jgi:hypothetical protein